MVSFPNCKINLGLNILRKRSDGFHDIETVFCPLPFFDAVEIIETKAYDEILFSASGRNVAGDDSDNLCIKAWQLLKKDFPALPNIQMHLHKELPMGAGLGGGSADGVFVLKLLNRKFNLNLSADDLARYALQLGSDGPFFIINKPCYASGRGEELETVNIDLDNYKFVLVNPGIHISTADAFSEVTPALPGKSVKEIVQQPIATWKQELENDFEKTIFTRHEEIKKIKEELYKGGAVYASMSGSGSTVYGIFKKEKELRFSFPSDYFIKELPGQLQ